MQNPVGAELFHVNRWETDMTKLIVAFRNFENASNIHQSPFFGILFASWQFKHSTCYTVKKLKLPVCLIQHHAMNVRVYRIVEAQIYSFFTPALHKSEWSVSRPNRFTPSRSSWYSNYPISGWVGPRAEEGVLDKKNVSFPVANQTKIPRVSSSQPTTT